MAWASSNGMYKAVCMYVLCVHAVQAAVKPFIDLFYTSIQSLFYIALHIYIPLSLSISLSFPMRTLFPWS